MLRKQQQILAERLRNAEELSAMYAKRLQTGDANVIETNKINLELLNVKTEASLNETALRNKIQELTALNGNIPVVFEDSDYPAVIFPTNYEELKTEVLASDYTLQALNSESAAARKQITVNKSQWLPKLELGYRTSIIAKKGYIVLEAVIRLQKGKKEEIKARMDELKEKRITKQPLEYPSAGSTFKRPEGYFAGKLIQDAGLQGFSVGGAQVSMKHCGFVINKDNATAADVAELMRKVSEQVEEKFGVRLEPEVKRLGEF